MPDTSEPEDSNGESNEKAHLSRGKRQDSDNDDEHTSSGDDDDDNGFGGRDSAHIREVLAAEVCHQFSVNKTIRLLVCSSDLFLKARAHLPVHLTMTRTTSHMQMMWTLVVTRLSKSPIHLQTWATPHPMSPKLRLQSLQGNRTLLVATLSQIFQQASKPKESRQRVAARRNMT